jgi:hypothetical protein
VDVAARLILIEQVKCEVWKLFVDKNRLFEEEKTVQKHIPDNCL